MRMAAVANLPRDPLAYLPRRRTTNFERGSLIYGGSREAAGLYLLMTGRVKISGTGDDGGETISRMVRPEGLFGESCLVGGTNRSETAIALDDVTLMSWSRAEIEQQIDRDPLLGVALCQAMVKECLDLQHRIESVATHKTPERVMLALLHLAGDLGTPMPDGATRIASLTHRTIAEFVGTSREIVTCQMNRLRRLGLCRYSRAFIDIYEPAMRETLQRNTLGLSRDAGLPRHAGSPVW
jgi:CRP/FNR family cyclic AMP-dependent transcriptional regulator